ncbi:Mis12 protein-domain-containing protein [Xylaria bambusicola]|uniref:Mis12 protein-domain-containing protein n=1 Tax=Xylaria bambusicola TaxID=326684 RepID=UPI0020077F5C|nr:Mis12 protein-domain-containing protein [Xylaria bambusicola]KAI0526564.1 Mis12 protein-domain-containing protein [Xylaria bambusicola]
MTTSFASETELLTEHFGYPPVSLLDDIINSVNILAERALNSVEQGLLNAPPAALGFKAPKPQDAAAAAESEPSPADRAQSEVEAGTHQLETLLCASIDRDFDKFELYVLRNIFTVRPPELCNWIRLSHYEGLNFSSRRNISVHTDENNTVVNNNNNVSADTPTIESITTLRRRLRESMRLNALLTAERARNDALLENLRRLVGDSASAGPQVKAESTSPAQGNPGVTDGQAISGDDEKPKNPFAFLHKKGDLASSGGGAAPLATTAGFTLSQMQALRALSTALSNLLSDLKSSTAGAPDGETQGSSAGGSRSWRRERAEYVEAATRRHLETMHGLELSKHGEVRDGEWQGPGRSLARGEVEGLERVVAMLGDEDGADIGSTFSATRGVTSSSSAAHDRGQMDES